MNKRKNDLLQTEDQLRKIIKQPPAIMAKRLLSTLDCHSLEIIHKSSIVALGIMQGTTPIELINISQNKIQVIDKQTLKLKTPNHHGDKEGPKHYCSLYFIMPGINHTLRINGEISNSSLGWQTISIRELFVHCARAKVRADFWSPKTSVKEICLKPSTEKQYPAIRETTLGHSSIEFIQRSPYLLMLTSNSLGQTELSPRGDPQGFVSVIDQKTLLLPERPGNKVALSLTNILSTGQISLAFMIPGTGQILNIYGQASITTNTQYLNMLEIKNKIPKLAIIISIESVVFSNNQDLLEAKLWSEDYFVDAKAIPSFSKVLAQHMNGSGLLGKATTAVVDMVVKKDLKNLY